MIKSFVIAALVLAGAPAFAASAGPATVRVATADLDLGARAGVRELDRRLAAAVREVCPFPLPTDLRTTAEHRACEVVATHSAADARAHALAQVAASARLAAR